MKQFKERTIAQMQSRIFGNGYDYLTIACTPHDEPCTQVGGSLVDMITECTALIHQLIRMHGEPPEGAEIFILRNIHDEGEYYEAAVAYTEAGEGSETDYTETGEYALDLENGIPEKWDEEAIAYLREHNHSLYRPAKVIPLRKTG